MAFVPGFEYDIFVSYAHADNEDGWVNHVVEELRNRLKQLTAPDELSIWFDPKLGGADAGESAVKSAALLLAILSPQAMASGFCRREWHSFEHAAAQTGGMEIFGKTRMVKVLKTSIGEALEPYPNALGFRFYQEMSGIIYGPLEVENYAFHKTIVSLADACCDTLKLLRARAKLEVSAAAKVEVTFLSYARKEDSEFALRLAKDLRSSGATIWLDQDIPAGRHWDRAVETALQNSPLVLVVLSRSSVDSENVVDEAYFALDQGKRVIPLLLTDCQVPFRLRRLQYIDFRQDYALALNRLLDTLRAG